jgi:selenocysteine-specific elongation factor
VPTVVIGTAGHIDHGKTTLLRALTGIDADRLPEERERGMTIDVGFAHLELEDGTSLDFVDVPGHDRLIGNMLVGAGEIDAVLLVVAADDGPRAQTLEHLELLDALGLRDGVVAITKADAVDPVRAEEVAAATRALVDRTCLAGAPIVRVSARSGAGLPELRQELLSLRDSVAAQLLGRPPGPMRLAVDRAFTVRGRGLVVTGTLRGSIGPDELLRAEPGANEARVRQVQVHHGPVPRADGGRAALNLGGVEAAAIRRGVVLTSGLGVVASDRILVSLRRGVALGGPANPRATPWPPRASVAVRLHLWTESVDASVRAVASDAGRLTDGSQAAILQLARPIAVLPGARAVLRDPGSGRTIAAVTVLHPHPPRGVSRRRMTGDRIARLAAAAGGEGSPLVEAVVELHGAIRATELESFAAALPQPGNAPVPGRSLVLATDVTSELSTAALQIAGTGPTLAELRAELLARLRRLATIERADARAALDALDRLLGDLLEEGRLLRDGNRVRPRDGTAAGQLGAERAAAERAAAGLRLEAALDVDVPPSLAGAMAIARCAPEALIELERSGRIVRVEDDLAWTGARYASLRDRAVAMARLGPLTPAAFRDAIGGNRRIALAVLEDLDRKGFLRRTAAGHVPGGRAASPAPSS